MKYAATLFVLLLASAGCALAQSPSLTEDFAEGFLYHSIFATSRSTDSDGTVVYRKNDDRSTLYATVRQSTGDPCVLISTRFGLSLAAAEPVRSEVTFNLQGVSFKSERKHHLAPKEGTYLILTGPRVYCATTTVGSPSRTEHRSECHDTLEATIEATMFATFERAVARLRGLCGWK
jgi:hypothetical protein